MINQLNDRYAIDGQLKFIDGTTEFPPDRIISVPEEVEGFPIIQIENNFAKATIALYGGHVLSFQPMTEAEDLLFLSETARIQAGKGLRGGIPVCWPWFGPHPEDSKLPSHGFVRNRFWSVLSTATTPEGETQIQLGLTDTPETRKLWPHAWELIVDIVVGDTLTVGLITRNRGNEPFTITQALHTYFQVGNIDGVRILGLDRTEYIDKVDGGAQKSQAGVVEIDSEVDRIYMNVPPKLAIDDSTWKRQIQILSKGSSSAVVWNPWSEKAAKFADLSDDGYLRFVCVETTNAGQDQIEVFPGHEYRLESKIRN
ncbi:MULTISPECIES: D-hexose-6-phosphate mutarotase [unclassified Roseofilum]|uniref:D-hexose-6-phosphate mutarotase n=1 Tax=unclassified Roseofilum TaxID=2620099 RepID=UPI000E803669|nr:MULTISPECIES: D-hexose-6-phosphate mutarotase [unclassified Roseofilum]HBQ97821.1 D-hexose-6-phosphate mutarotase [Cyanobacteria bacterium UBA11691]MBP0009724.1 D-hexose-6-phosphate mutarotase [Roseofilum sp. Belize Diploria]MBP0015219.1 D-hexose-6-phosphate mutarotase [Roseofilum sp. SID3]MBP0024495.1 D-hexose-6-phosphate mutarotase [Roseofilum sp. SID2]MBP0034384.1 D-hexose-6-phosphate mutarotase [Roseofilum sp. Belize BBD 4]